MPEKQSGHQVTATGWPPTTSLTISCRLRDGDWVGVVLAADGDAEDLLGRVHPCLRLGGSDELGLEDRLDAVEGYHRDHLDRGTRDALGVVGKDGLLPLRDVVAEPYEKGISSTTAATAARTYSIFA